MVNEGKNIIRLQNNNNYLCVNNSQVGVINSVSSSAGTYIRTYIRTYFHTIEYRLLDLLLITKCVSWNLSHSVMDRVTDHCAMDHCVTNHCITDHCATDHCVTDHCITDHCVTDHCVTDHSVIVLSYSTTRVRYVLHYVHVLSISLPSLHDFKSKREKFYITTMIHLSVDL